MPGGSGMGNDSFRAEIAAETPRAARTSVFNREGRKVRKEVPWLTFISVLRSVNGASLHHSSGPTRLVKDWENTSRCFPSCSLRP